MFIPVICFSSCSRLLLTGSPENKSFVSPLHQKKKRCQKLPPAVETQDQGIKKAKTSALWLNYSCFYLNFLLLSTHFKLISLSLPYDTSCLTCRVQLSEVISITCLHSTEEKPSKLYLQQAITTLDSLLGILWLFFPKAYDFLLGLERILIKK